MKLLINIKASKQIRFLKRPFLLDLHPHECLVQDPIEGKIKESVLLPLKIRNK